MKITFPSYKEIPAGKNLLILLSVLIASYLSVWLLGEKPLLAALPLAAIGALFLLYVRSRKLLLIYILFALGGTLQEIFFISKGLWKYGPESFFSVPLYLPFVWGNIGLIAVAALKGILIIDRKRRLYHDPPGFRKILFILIFTALAAVLAIKNFYLDPLALISILLLLDILYLILMRSLALAIVGLFALIGGGIGDLIAVSLGLWSYPAGPAFFGVPLYIFVGWDVVGLLIAGLYLALDAKGEPEKV